MNPKPATQFEVMINN